MSREVIRENLMSVGTNKTFGPGWNLTEETMLLTLDERSEWMEHALPSGAKNMFKLLKKPEIKKRMNSSIIDVT